MPEGDQNTLHPLMMAGVMGLWCHFQQGFIFFIFLFD
jgi:hypothetical protein